MCRGYYTGRDASLGRTTLAAWNWRRGQLSQAWTFDTYGHPELASYRGQGNHNLSVADVDGDGKDEIIYGSMAVDHDGSPLYNTNLEHGDAMHCSVLDPSRPGLQVWACHEDYAGNGGIGLSFRDAGTGEVLWTVPGTKDVGRALAADIDPRYSGDECWGATGGLYSAKGVQIASSPPSSMNFAIWWDGDLLREILDGSNNDGGSTGSPYINKWNWLSGTTTRLLTATGCYANNSTKATPCLSADILGDWREEAIWHSSDNKELRIYTTTIPTTHRLYTLMHDPVYRLGVAWQNTAYNQPPHTGFYLGDGMTLPPPTPNIRLVENQPNAAGNWMLWR
jgi:rhamnogalacturonan endolyase